MDTFAADRQASALRGMTKARRQLLDEDKIRCRSTSRQLVIDEASS
jgi:hypothetical protein